MLLMLRVVPTCHGLMVHLCQQPNIQHTHSMHGLPQRPQNRKIPGKREALREYMDMKRKQ